MEAPKRAVIAGGSGFVGRALTGVFLASGWRVSILTRAARPSSDRRLQYLVWDGVNGGDWEAALDGASAVVTLSGADISKRWTPAYKKLLFDSRLDSTKAVVRAIEKAKAKPAVVVQGSAVGYYGNRDQPSDESAPAGQGFLAGLASAWEQAGAPLDGMGVRRCQARTGLVLGHGGLLAKVMPPFKYYLGAVFGSGRQGFPWVHVLDEARAIAYLAETPTASGPYNLIAPGASDLYTFCEALGRALRRPVPFRIPGFALKAVLGDMAREMLLWGCFAKPARLTAAGFQFRFPTIEAALADILSRVDRKPK